MCSTEAVGSIPAVCIFFSVDSVDLEFNTTWYHLVKSTWYYLVPGGNYQVSSVPNWLVRVVTWYMWLTVKTSHFRWHKILACNTMASYEMQGMIKFQYYY